MCLTCGCALTGDPTMVHEGHGDPAHITYQKLVHAAAAAHISPKQAAKNLRESLKVAKQAQVRMPAAGAVLDASAAAGADRARS